MANYVNAVRTGNLLYLAGKGPGLPGHPLPVGKVGRDFTKEQGYEYARQTVLSFIAVMKAELGDLDWSNASSSFWAWSMPRLISASSPKSSTAVRISSSPCSAIADATPARRGKGLLPRGIPVEIEVIVEVGAAPARAAAGVRKAAPKAKRKSAKRKSR